MLKHYLLQMYFIIRKMIMYIRKKKFVGEPWDESADHEHCRYREYIQKNRLLDYRVRCVSAEFPDGFKWVGGQSLQDVIYGIPNGETRMLLYRWQDAAVQLEGNLRKGNFKWTGACVYQGKIYGFPRTANSFVMYDPNRNEMDEIPIDTNYMGEHHYGGVCTGQGIVYQPPRGNADILVTDLNTMECRHIRVLDTVFGKQIRDRYCGSILHPNGCIYFLPEQHGKVIKFDIKTERWCFIGKIVSPMVFDAKVAMNGDIYGFSAYEAGILHIDVKRDRCEMIHKEILPGAYGTKLGVNGKLYSIPGDGAYVWEYNVEEDSVKKIYEMIGEGKAKYAGGLTDRKGVIWGIPALTQRNLLYYEPGEAAEEIPENIYVKYFADNY